MRGGEALGLQWKDIDNENKTITISRSLLPSKNGLIFHNPKTEKSKRVISVPEAILNDLQQVKEKQEEYKNLLGAAYKDFDLVSCYNDGSPINLSNLSHVFSTAMKRINLRQGRFHDLRHYKCNPNA